jgi:hypothetical protein
MVAGPVLGDVKGVRGTVRAPWIGGIAPGAGLSRDACPGTCTGTGAAAGARFGFGFAFGADGPWTYGARAGAGAGAAGAAGPGAGGRCGGRSLGGGGDIADGRDPGATVAGPDPEPIMRFTEFATGARAGRVTRGAGPCTLSPNAHAELQRPTAVRTAAPPAW